MNNLFLRVKALILIPVFFFAVNANVLPQDTSKVKLVSKKSDLIQFILPLALFGFGLTCFDKNNIAPNNTNVYDWRQRNYKDFHTRADDFLAFAPTVAAYGLQFMGVKGTNDWKKMTLIYAATNAILFGTAEGLKMITKNYRPDSSDTESFPSAHAAFVFAAADMLNFEYGSKSVWISIAGYTTATAVGMIRILNNKHWISDVFVGAGIGILSNRLAYLLYDKLIKNKSGKGNNLNFMFSPDIKNKGMKFGLQFKI
jgi:hypothetical protein